MKELLKSAIANLAMSSINLRNAKVEMNDGYNATIIDTTESKTQSFRNVVKIELIEMINKDDANDKKIFYSFIYDAGMRLIKEENSDENDDNVIITIEACFEATYRAKKELSVEELEAFGCNNVGYNVWPYWREYVQSMCGRIGIKPIKVPFYNFKKSDILKVSDIDPA